MTLIHPEALLLLPTLLLAVGLLLYLFRWKAKSLELFARGSVLPALIASSSASKQRVKAIFLVAALAAAVVALARPIYGSILPTPKPGQGDIVIALDVSLSMTAKDVSPSRLELAKTQILNLIDHLQGDRIGLVVFAGDATLRFPTTYDYGAAKVLVRAVEPDSAPTPGSSIASGVRTAILALRQSKAPLRAVFLLSDGEDLIGQVPEAVDIATQEQIPVYTIGIGTTAASTIPLADGTLKKDKSGAIVQTKLDDASLRLLAAGTKASYTLGTSAGRELQSGYETLHQLGRNTQEPSGPSNDLTSLFVLLAFSLLIAEYVLSERRAIRPMLNPIVAAFPLMLMLTGACGFVESSVFSLNEAGAKLYQQSLFDQALESFRQAEVQRPDIPELSINTAAALYKTKEYERSLREIQRALIADKQDLKERAQFHTGNAYYQLGQYQEAYNAFKRALLEDPNDADAKINLELALQQLQQQSQQQGQNPPNPPPAQGDSSQQPDPNAAQQGPMPQTQPNASGSGNGSPSQRNNPTPPSDDVRKALRDAGDEISLEDALRILDALRGKEPLLQGRYQQPTPQQQRGPASRPDKDW